MQLDLNLTPKLILHWIEENMTKEDELISVELSLSFYGEYGTAYVVIDKLNSEYPQYAMIESSSDLHESFENQLEEEEVWEVIVEKVKEFKTQYDKQIAEY